MCDGPQAYHCVETVTAKNLYPIMNQMNNENKTDYTHVTMGPYHIKSFPHVNVLLPYHPPFHRKITVACSHVYGEDTNPVCVW